MPLVVLRRLAGRRPGLPMDQICAVAACRRCPWAMPCASSLERGLVDVVGTSVRRSRRDPPSQVLDRRSRRCGGWQRGTPAPGPGRGSVPTSGGTSRSSVTARCTRCAPTPGTSTRSSGTPPPPGVTDLDAIDVRVLRGWLGAVAATGAARSTVARRAAAARTFTAWAARTGRLRSDPGLLLGVPRARTALPGGAAQRPGDRAHGPRGGRRGRRLADGSARPRRARGPVRLGCAGRRAGRPWTSTTSTTAGGRCGSSARVARSAPCPSVCPPSVRSTTG